MHIGIILTIVFSLSVGQFCIEYRQASPSSASAAGNRPGFYTPLPLYPSSNDADGVSWDGSRDKARQIMLGALPPSGDSRSVTPTAGMQNTTSGPLSSQLFDPRYPELKTSPHLKPHQSSGGRQAVLRSGGREEV
ncbi:hypothetical protein FRC00_009954 [Tulasnella sp. 408]|nr:hypothetical protein FRC00_009954 [Tulasnella sp. 408]